jgi:hypothetical protein
MKLIEQLSIPSKTGQSRMNAFVERYPEPGFLYLACHAAFPVALTSDLLYKIWLNFKQDEKGNALDIPLEAVALLANSVLCRNIGNDLFEIYEDVREALQALLQANEALGTARMQHLARFIVAYTDHCADKIPNPAFKKALRWKAEAYLNPKKAALELIDLFAEKTEKGEDTSTVKVYLSWVKGHSTSNTGTGIDYIGLAEDFFEGVRQFQVGNMKAAAEVLKRIAPFIQDEEAAGQTPFKTRLPAGFLALMNKPAAATAREVTETEPIRLLAHDHANNKALIAKLMKNSPKDIAWVDKEANPDYVMHLGQKAFFLTLPGQPYQPLHCPLPFMQLEGALELVHGVEKIRRLKSKRDPRLVSAIHIQLLKHEQWENLDVENGVLTLDTAGDFPLGSSSFRILIEGGPWPADDCHMLLSWANFSVGKYSPFENPAQTDAKDSIVFFPFGNEGLSFPVSQRAIDYDLPYDEYFLTLIIGGQALKNKYVNFPGLPRVVDFGHLQRQTESELSDLPELPDEGYEAHQVRLRIKNPYYKRPDPERLKSLLANQDAEPFMRAIYFESTSLYPQYELKSGFEWDYRSPTEKIAIGSPKLDRWQYLQTLRRRF